MNVLLEYHDLLTRGVRPQKGSKEMQILTEADSERGASMVMDFLSKGLGRSPPEAIGCFIPNARFRF